MTDVTDDCGRKPLHPAKHRAVEVSHRSPGCLFPLDSGPCSRLYDSVMVANHQASTPILQIGELAKRTELTVDAIRFYEKRRLLPRAMRTTGRFRLYMAEDIERIRFIQRMQALGFSLREIRELGNLRARSVDACESVRKLLTAKMVEVRTKMRDLERLKSELAADLRRCNAELEHRRGHASSACPVLETSEAGLK